MKNFLQNIVVKLFLSFAAIPLTQQLFAQITDNFSDGDFINDPNWSGMDSLFVVEDLELKLNGLAGGGVAYVSVAGNPPHLSTWEFQTRFEFNPSPANYAAVYLTSDQPDLSKPLNGYFVLLGNTADEVSLFRQEGTVLTKIIDGTNGRLDLSSLTVTVKVSRDAGGNWQLWTDVGNTGVFIAEGIATDKILQDQESYFGIRCTYTATRADKFYFDDFKVSNEVVSDTMPPQCTGITVRSATSLSIDFSEPLLTKSIVDLQHFNVDGVGIPASVSLAENNQTLLITFPTAFSEYTSYRLSLTGVTDVAGNLMIPAVFDFSYSAPLEYKAVVISEIFPDPTPPVGLPETEFVELFNRSGKIINLSGWTISDGSTTLTLPARTFTPGEYLILTSSPENFTGYNNVFGSHDFPSLNNAGDLLVLRDASGNTIDSLQYTDAWYKDAQRKSGGWSIELIDPENRCSGQDNWVVSDDSSGGTPGKQNSVFASKPDLSGPGLLAAIPTNVQQLRLDFSERLDKNLPDVSSFQLDPMIAITAVSFTDESLQHLNLTLSNALQSGTLYSITISNVHDCAGNIIQPNSNAITFGNPQQATVGDIAVNEILFNPKPTGVDFIELVNTSGKFINLKNWSVGTLDERVPFKANLITENDILLHPGAYLVLTEDPEILKSEYPLSRLENMLTVEHLPSLNDDYGSVAVFDPTNLIIDSMRYAASMQSVFIRDAEGVSLERISVELSPTDPENWKSSSSLVGFATPGYLNANARELPGLLQDGISVEPEVFDPSAGHPDFTQLYYSFNSGGYVANIRIFDSRGRVIKRVANNEILGTHGAFRWDGDQEDGTRARTGYYMILFEVFDSFGAVRIFKSPVAVAAQF